MRTSLTLLALATAVASVVSLRGIATGFTRSFADVYRSHSVDVVVSRQGSADRLSSSVGQEHVQRIAALDDVAKCDGVLLETLSLEQQQIFGVPTMGIPRGSWLRDDYRWIDQVDASQNDEKRLSLGVHLAERAGVSAGDTLQLFEEDYLVAGIFESRSAWENGSMLMPLQLLQQMVDRIDQVTYVNVVLTRSDAETAAKAVAAIQAIDQRLHAMATDDFVRTDTRMQLASAMAWMTSLIALVIGGIGTLNTMMTSVLERTREIGILRAIGWPRWQVMAMILWESLMLAAAASAIGCVAAIAATTAMSQHPAVRGILVPSIDPATILEGVALAFLIGMAGAILPARRAASVMPTEAIRN